MHWCIIQSLMLEHCMQVLATAREDELRERGRYARTVLECFDRKVNDPEKPQSPLMHFLDDLLKVQLTDRLTSIRSAQKLHDDAVHTYEPGPLCQACST